MSFWEKWGRVVGVLMSLLGAVLLLVVFVGEGPSYLVTYCCCCFR